MHSASIFKFHFHDLETLGCRPTNVPESLSTSCQSKGQRINPGFQLPLALVSCSNCCRVHPIDLLACSVSLLQLSLDHSLHLLTYIPAPEIPT